MLGVRRKSLTFDTTERKYLLFTIDLLLLLSATLLYQSSLDFADRQEGPWFLVIVVLWSVFSFVFDMYDLADVSRFYPTLKRTFFACMLTISCYLLFQWGVIETTLPAKQSLMLYAGAFFALIMWRYLFTRLFNRPIFFKRILIMGSGWPCQSLLDVFTKGDIFRYYLGYQVVGLVDPTFLDAERRGIRVIQNSGNLLKLVKRLNVDEIIVSDALSGDGDKRTMAALARCRMCGMVVTPLHAFYEELTGRVLIHSSGTGFMRAFPYSKHVSNKAYRLFSRAVDVAFGIVGMLLCGFFIPFVYLANKRCSKGPLFYTQERVGLYGNPFKLTKFRSMVVDAEKDGAAWAQQNDCRITNIGKILRRSHIDELPQAWSVLKGDMSLIGPRPERPVFVEQLKHEIPFYDTRHLAKPGITGWAQAIYKYGSNKQDALMKLQYDLYYLKNRSVMLDIKVILKTISVVIRFKGL